MPYGPCGSRTRGACALHLAVSDGADSDASRRLADRRLFDPTTDGSRRSGEFDAVPVADLRPAGE
ncbi:hypothetical protein [Haloglomus salinum]|uniref:hypothetical protein n=1 Tax=Haloglomus salinum TaxID=2962673 RepID=UPI0020C9C75E|nr:hypothetical protein [Haloglomus salinum]